MNKYKKKLKLTGHAADGFLAYESDNETNPLLIRIEQVSLDGRVTLSFSNDSYKVWRESIYEPNSMERDNV
jgi:hypothetical protein